MPTITNAELTNLVMPALMELANRKLPPAGALRIRRMVRELGNREKDLNAERIKLLTEYGLKGEDGKLRQDQRGAVVFGEGSEEEFSAAYAPFLAEQIESVATLTMAHLGDAEIEPSLLIGLCDLLDEGDD